MRRASWICALVVVAGCGTAPASDRVRNEGFDGKTPLVVTGRIIAGQDSLTGPTLYLESGQSLGIDGDLIGELQRLSGARVTVVGDSGSGESIRARGYAILEVNGERPRVGVVARRSGGYALFLETGPVGLDSSSAAPLSALLGAKIWAVGPLQGEILRIESYGVIRVK